EINFPSSVFESSLTEDSLSKRRKSTPCPSAVMRKSCALLTASWLLSSWSSASPASCSGDAVSVTVSVTVLGDACSAGVSSLLLHAASPATRSGAISNAAQRGEEIWDFLMSSIPSHQLCTEEIRRLRLMPLIAWNFTIRYRLGFMWPHVGCYLSFWDGENAFNFPARVDVVVKVGSGRDTSVLFECAARRTSCGVTSREGNGIDVISIEDKLLIVSCTCFPAPLLEGCAGFCPNRAAAS